MEAKKNKMCKVRLRRLRPDLMDKFKTKRVMAKADLQFSSSSSESEDDDIVMDECIEKITVQLKSPLALSNNKDFDPYVLLTEAQAVLELSNEMAKKATSHEDDKMESDVSTNADAKPKPSSTVVDKPNKKPKLRKKQKCNYYRPLEENGGGDQFHTMLKPPVLEHDFMSYHSDDQCPSSYNCNHARATTSLSTAAVLALSPSDRRGSSGSSSSLLSVKSSIRLANLFDRTCISVMDDENPPTALSKILSIKEFDPLAPQQILAIIIKSIVSLSELSQRDDNVITVDIDKRRIQEFSAMSQEEKKNCLLNPFMVNMFFF